MTSTSKATATPAVGLCTDCGGLGWAIFNKGDAGKPQGEIQRCDCGLLPDDWMAIMRACSLGYGVHPNGIIWHVPARDTIASRTAEVLAEKQGRSVAATLLHEASRAVADMLGDNDIATDSDLRDQALGNLEALDDAIAKLSRRAAKPEAMELLRVASRVVEGLLPLAHQAVHKHDGRCACESCEVIALGGKFIERWSRLGK